MPNKLKILLLSTSLLLASCVEDPVNSSAPGSGNMNGGIFILCEGIWGYDNSALAYYDFTESHFYPDIFAVKNSGRKIGDTANDMVRKGDTAFIAVTTGAYIEAVSLKSGKSFGRMDFPDAKALRKICIVNDTTGLVTDLYKDVIRVFNPATLIVRPEIIATGKGPEGIIRIGGRVFVANSGFGDYGKDDPTAGTIWAYDAGTLQKEAAFYCGPNVIELTSDEAGNLIAAYKETPSHRAKDSLGGIVVFDPLTLKTKLHFRTNVEKVVSRNHYLYYLNQEGLFLSDYEGARQLIYANPKPEEFWYALAFSPLDGTVWIANARNYTVSGEIFVLNENTRLVLKRFDTGINPNTFLFYPY